MKLEAHETQFFIGLSLPTKENAFFSEIKRTLSQVEHLSSPPHITLKPPFFMRNERYILEKLAAFARRQRPFTITLEHVGSFTHKKSATVYLAPTKSEDIKKLERGLTEAFPRFSPEQNFTPHLTLAHRIKSTRVAEVKTQLREMKLSLQLDVHTITLFSKKDQESWRAHTTFVFGGT